MDRNLNIENKFKCRDVDRVGFRFHPNDKELIKYYLNHKINGRNHLVDHVIGEINLLQCHPQDIPAISISDGDQWWYFFNRLDFKYSNSKRADRKTGRGYWKATGKIRVIKEMGKNIGQKRSLVYYEEHSGSKSTKTNWIIHEYAAISDESNFVLCKLKYVGDLDHDKHTFVRDEDEVDPISTVDSFLDLEDWPYEEYTEILPN